MILSKKFDKQKKEISCRVAQRDNPRDSHYRGFSIEASKGSIETGKDADFLVFDKDLLTAEHEGFSYNTPKDVYFGGKIEILPSKNERKNVTFCHTLLRKEKISVKIGRGGIGLRTNLCIEQVE